MDPVDVQPDTALAHRTEATTFLDYERAQVVHSRWTDSAHLRRCELRAEREAPLEDVSGRFWACDWIPGNRLDTHGWRQCWVLPVIVYLRPSENNLRLAVSAAQMPPDMEKYARPQTAEG